MALDVTGSYRYPNPDIAWLAKHVEEILEPEIPIIDPHHHIWNQEGNPYSIDDLSADVASGHQVIATVFVQAHHGYRTTGPEALRCVGETERIEEAANAAQRNDDKCKLCAGIVGFADLTLGRRVGEVLDAHRKAAPARFRGVRHGVARDPHFPNGIVLRPAPPNMLADPEFRAGLTTLAEYGLSFDAMLYHCQIKELAAMAQAIPELPIVLDHFGCIIGVGPYIGREQDTFRTWRDDIRLLAQSPNVSIKLGGMGMIICGARFHERALPPSSRELADAWRPYVETCIEAFGAERCMFESNFPVDKAMFSYPVLWNAFKRLTAGASASEKAALLHATAARFYKLNVSLPAPA
ncbi:MAG: amidohydrolase family protein [Rhodoferax sp.]|nr:amidohydrolase family protein [Rhodoferax sp.]